MHREQFANRRVGRAFLGLQTFFHLQELGGILQADADITPDQTKRRGQQERQAPAPVMEVFNGHERMQTRDKYRTEQQPGGGARRDNAGVKAAFALRGVLGQKRRSPRVLTGGRKALHQPDQQQQRRSPQADVVVTRQQTNAKGRDSHDQNRPGQGAATPVFVAKMAPYQPADGTHDKRQRKHREGCQQTGCRIGLREKRQGDDGRQIAIRSVIKPLDKIAQKTGGGGAAQGLAFTAEFELLFGGQGKRGRDGGHDKYPHCVLVGRGNGSETLRV